MKKSKIKEFKKLRIAVLGFGGIGKHHVQVLNKLGAQICGVLTSSSKSAKNAASEINDIYGLNIAPYADLNKLITKSNPHAIHICTPDKYHFSSMVQAFEYNLPVFCEKPLFWNESICQEEVNKKLSIIENHPNRKIFMNTCNSSIIHQIKANIGSAQKITAFDLKFSTNGNKRFHNIATDLMPHGLSMLQELAGTSSKVKEFLANIGENKYFCRFKYNNINVSFEFSESLNSDKEMIFSINNKKYQRIQRVKNQKIYVSVIDLDTKEIFNIVNPLEVFIKNFLRFCLNPNINKKDDFISIAWNTSLMSNLLLQGK